MKIPYRLSTVSHPHLALRGALFSDLESLRDWKNANRKYFFHQEVITGKDQAAWWTGYLARPNDFMFMVEHEQRPVGCLGYRTLDDSIDVYNVILGDHESHKKGIMSWAIQTLCSYLLAEGHTTIGVRVLRTNPAVQWYEKNGFQTQATQDTYHEMTLNKTIFQAQPYRKVFVTEALGGLPA